MKILEQLKKLHIIIIGVVLVLMVGAAEYFFMIKPQQEKLQEETARMEAAKAVGNAASEARAQEELKQAKEEYADAHIKLEARMRKKMPNLSFDRRDIGMLALWEEQIYNLGPLLENYAKTGKDVEVTEVNFSVPAPPSNPNDATFDQTILVYDMGNVTVQGEFEEVMQNVTRWNNCNRLVMLSIPQLEGKSPELKCRYDVTCYIFPRELGGAKIPLAPGGGQAQ